MAKQASYGEFTSFSFAEAARNVVTFFADVINDLVVAKSRANEIETLMAKSDAELAKEGIKRNEIVKFVFRDKMYI